MDKAIFGVCDKVIWVVDGEDFHASLCRVVFGGLALEALHFEGSCRWQVLLESSSRPSVKGELLPILGLGHQTKYLIDDWKFAYLDIKWKIWI